MANEDQLKILNKGSIEWNAWRSENPDVVPDLSGSNLRQRNFGGYDLSSAKLTNSEMHGSDFFAADLTNADLSNSSVATAKFRRTKLDGALLVKTSLIATIFNDIDLSGAKLKDCSIENTIFTATKISVKSDSFRYITRCFIDKDTQLLSYPLPDWFLSKIGFRPFEIELNQLYNNTASNNHLAEITNNIFQARAGKIVKYYSCFISHSSEDQQLAERIYGSLENEGIKCFYAPHNLKPGRKINEQLEDAINTHDKLLLILSKSSINSSWVNFEIKRARKLEANTKLRKLFPIRTIPYRELEKWELFDSDTVTDLASEIRSYFIPWFSDYMSDDEFNIGIEKLIAALSNDSIKSS